jgi:hypothetical protein
MISVHEVYSDCKKMVVSPPSTYSFPLYSIFHFQVIWLQHFPGGWDKWEEKVETAPCTGHTPYELSSAGTWRGGVFGAQGVAVESFRCVSTMGFSNTLLPEIVDKRCRLFLVCARVR